VGFGTGVLKKVFDDTLFLRISGICEHLLKCIYDTSMFVLINGSAVNKNGIVFDSAEFRWNMRPHASAYGIGGQVSAML
jgi:hypothetical protein